MIVHRAAVLAGLLLAGPISQSAAPQNLEADPHELYERAQEALAKGRLQDAATWTSRLQSLIESRPDWDPEGAFAHDLLPPLRGRLKRLQGAAHKLDEFAAQALLHQNPPDIKDDISTVRDYTVWATSVIQRLRRQRDDIIGAALVDPEERALLARTDSYARTEALLENDVLRKMADEAGDDILGLLSGDPRLESVVARFRQLKRELMQSVADRDQLEHRLKEAGQREHSLLRALAAVVTDDDSLVAGPGVENPADVEEHFARSLDRELEALRGLSSLTSVEREQLLASLERHRRHDQVLARAGIGSDHGGRIEALAQAVAEIPSRDGIAASTGMGRLYWILLVILSLSAAVLAWLAFVRRRPRLSPRRRHHVGDSTLPVDQAATRKDAA